jgi:hypothetical protein
VAVPFCQLGGEGHEPSPAGWRPDIGSAADRHSRSRRYWTVNVTGPAAAVCVP